MDYFSETEMKEELDVLIASVLNQMNTVFGYNTAETIFPGLDMDKVLVEIMGQERSLVQQHTIISCLAGVLLKRFIKR